MMTSMLQPAPLRRLGPRVPGEDLVTEHHAGSQRHGIIVEFSEDGIRVQRPDNSEHVGPIQLEFELPGVDEVLWAHGDICFDQMCRVQPNAGSGLSGLVRTSGIRLVAFTDRHRRMLREYVRDTWAAIQSLRLLPDDDGEPPVTEEMLVSPGEWRG